MRKIILTFCLWLCCQSCAMAAINRDEALHLFVKADMAYKEGKYKEAVSFYEQILSGGWESGPVYYNAGNSYFRQDNLGKAILNYERAARLIPRDGDLEANLRYARSLVKGSPLNVGRSFLEKLADYSMRFVTRDEILGTILLFLFFAVLAHLTAFYFPAGPFKGQGWWRAFAGVAVCLVLIFILISLRQNNQAVALTETSARFEPREQATAHFELYQGQKIWIIKSEGLWQKIRRADGKIGWVEQKQMEEI